MPEVSRKNLSIVTETGVHWVSPKADYLCFWQRLCDQAQEKKIEWQFVGKVCRVPGTWTSTLNVIYSEIGDIRSKRCGNCFKIK